MRPIARALGAAALALVAIAQPAAAERLIATLSSHHVPITPTFTGAELVLFGLIEQDTATPRASVYDIIATVRGPNENLVVRRKDRVVGIWVNTDSRPFVQVPSYVAILSSRPPEQVASAEAIRRLQLGLRRILLPQQFGDDTADAVRDDPFRLAFLRLKQSRGLYVESTDAVKFLTPILYRANIPLPASAPVGRYSVDVKLFADRNLIARGGDVFDVVKFGFEQFVASAAVDNGLLYGLATVLMALLTGWIAAVVLRRD